jgi:predicted enzyme related to lactoylglutathione lyase
MALMINIDVPDLDAAIHFYTEAFGLKVSRHFGGFAELLGWPAPLYLLTKEAGTVGAGGDRRRYERHWTPVHLDVLVEDVDAAVERAVSAGAILERPATTAAFGRIAGLADPFGNGVCVLKLSERGYDVFPERA